MFIVQNLGLALRWIAHAKDKVVQEGLNSWLPALIYIAGMVFVVALMLCSYYLGPRQLKRAAALIPYESGIQPTADARGRLSVHFYLIALFFVVFDVESIFIYLWASSVRELGWPGFLKAFIFIAVMALALLYLLGIGALHMAAKGKAK